MSECSTKNGSLGNEDYWEVPRAIISVESAQDSEQRTDLFHLRHKTTQLCIPVNPEYPGLPFDCYGYFGMEEAIADSFNGLVECNSDFAAVFEMDDSNSLYLKNSHCPQEWATENDVSDLGVIFMTYNNPAEEKRIVVWGETTLLGLEDKVEDFHFGTEWAFVDITETIGRNSVIAAQSNPFGNLFDITPGEIPTSPGKR
eukprot:jgi/Psemu1/301030/fgenesh1_kg.24_\